MQVGLRGEATAQAFTSRAIHLYLIVKPSINLRLGILAASQLKKISKHKGMMTVKEEPRGRSKQLFRRIAAAAMILTSAFGLQFVPGLEASAADDKPMFMFVHTADDVKADPAAGTLRLVNVNPQTVYFSDRPERIAGHMTLADYLKEWTEGKDNFGQDPPNATLSVYEGGTQENTLAIVELTDPVVDGADLIYSYKSLGGTMPKSGGATTVFIDMIGIGGGVGVGYHGVGVGLRGPGVL